MPDLTTICTQGHFGAVTCRIAAMATQGHFLILADRDPQLPSLTIDIAGRSGGIAAIGRSGGITTMERSSGITIDS